MPSGEVAWKMPSVGAAAKRCQRPSGDAEGGRNVGSAITFTPPDGG
jgi:hypothetical protein